MSPPLISTRGLLLCLAPGALHLPPVSGDTYFYALRRQIPLRTLKPLRWPVHG